MTRSDGRPADAYPLLLLYAGQWRPDAIAAALAADRVEAVAVTALADLEPIDRPTVFVLDTAALTAFGAGRLAALVDAGVSIVALATEPGSDIPPDVPIHILSAYLTAPWSSRPLLVALRTAFREATARRHVDAARAETADRATEVTDLTEIGIRLLTERDHDALLRLILSQARRLSRADAASLYLVETDGEGGERQLHFKLTQNDSRPDIPFSEFTMPLDDRSLAGYAALAAEPLAIADVYALGADVPYTFNRSFDERYGYRTKSMLVIPMPNHHGEVIGVLQLINRKADARPFSDARDVERRAVPFDARTVTLVRSLAGQAAVSLENAQLYQSIERLFEGFVTAAVTAIEQRDPATSGHSGRVATMSCALATAADRAGTGTFAAVRFTTAQLREIRYAGLLHDFGKVGVREQVLVKQKKLFPADLAVIEGRHAYLVRSAQWRFERERADRLERHGRDGYDEFLAALAARHAEELACLERFLDAVRQANEPTVVPDGEFETLRAIGRATYEGLGGELLPFLTGPEIRSLSVRKGNLDDDEWVEMRRHVSLTYGFLRSIPWTKELMGVPDIAHGHHEKLNGAGYPRGLAGPAIPLQTRMMTIADIYDALTAADRPYKPAVPRDRALDILHDEVRQGMIDADLFDLFVAARVFEEGKAAAG